MRYKFRAWHIAHKSMLESRDQGYQGEVFKWLKEGQPIQIMQCIGINDLTGTPVFEGDIVEWYVNDVVRVGIVEYVAESACYDLKNFHDQYHVCNDWYRGEYKVLGNIYEHSFLLEAK